jgi:feruloyl esterase
MIRPALSSHRLARVLAAATLLTLAGAQAYAQSAQFENWKEASKGRTPKSPCAGLRALTGYDLSIDTATAVPAQNGAAAFCLVQGLVMPEVRFEVALPADWNGRLYMFGNGGFAGEPLSSPGRVRARNHALQRGFATAQTNTGHDAVREPLAAFASSPQKLTDYAYRAIHVTALAAKTLVRAYYETPVDRSYFVGCSTGGRQGLIAAQRFPEDFDGIVVGAPVLDFSGSMALGAAIGRALETGPLGADTVRLIGEKVYAKCDALDGLADGVIADPRRCQFDVNTDVPKCTAGGETSSCLTNAQAHALRVIYGGLTSKDGTLFPGFPVGAETMVPTAAGLRTGWHPWIIAEGQQTLSTRFAESFFKEMATPGTPIDWRTFEAERDADKLTWIGSLLDAKDPDLSAFRARGGKILMYFGWADPALTPLMGIDYYERVRQTMGRATEGFFRLFMQPGVLHCGGGPGPSEFDSITPLVDWVERGIAPDRLIATLRQDGRMVRSRPLCVYPAVARYKGSGNVEEAASFECAAPE